MTILCSLDDRYSYLIHVHTAWKSSLVVQNRESGQLYSADQTQPNTKADPKLTLGLLWIFLFLFVSALGLIRVSTWGSLYALTCEADPLFTYRPLYIPNIGTYVEKFGHFSVAIYWLLLNWGLLSMSALDGSARVMQPLQTLK